MFELRMAALARHFLPAVRFKKPDHVTAVLVCIYTHMAAVSSDLAVAPGVLWAARPLPGIEAAFVGLGFVQIPSSTSSSTRPAAIVSMRRKPAAISTSGTAAWLNGISTPFLPPSDSSRMSPPPKFCTAVTLPTRRPGLVLHGKPDQVGMIELAVVHGLGSIERSMKSSVLVSASAALRSLTLLNRTTTTSLAGLMGRSRRRGLSCRTAGRSRRAPADRR